jgi:hypothetical protein
VDYASFGYTDWGVKWRFQEETKTRPAISTYPQVIFIGNLGLARLGVLDPGTDLLLPIEASRTYGNFVFDGEVGLLFRQFTGTEFDYGVARNTTRQSGLRSSVNCMTWRRPLTSKINSFGTLASNGTLASTHL